MNAERAEGGQEQPRRRRERHGAHHKPKLKPLSLYLIILNAYPNRFYPTSNSPRSVRIGPGTRAAGWSLSLLGRKLIKGLPNAAGNAMGL